MIKTTERTDSIDIPDLKAKIVLNTVELLLVLKLLALNLGFLFYSSKKHVLLDVSCTILVQNSPSEFNNLQQFS